MTKHNEDESGYRAPAFIILGSVVLTVFILMVFNPGSGRILDSDTEPFVSDCETECGSHGYDYDSYNCIAECEAREDGWSKAAEFDQFIVIVIERAKEMCEQDLHDLTGSYDSGPGDCWPVIDERRKSWKEGDCKKRCKDVGHDLGRMRKYCLERCRKVVKSMLR